MAKLTDISSGTEEFFNGVLNNTTIPKWVEFKLLCDTNQKEMYKIQRANALLEKLTKYDFIIIINENIFDCLPEEMQKIALDECLAGVFVNPDTAVSTLNKVDFKTHTGVLQKYGDKQVVALHESIKTLYEEKKLKELEEKQAEKERKKEMKV